MIWIYGDDNRDRKKFPLITFLLIALNVYVFFSLQECGTNSAFTYSLTTVPAEIINGEDIDTSREASDFTRTPLYETPVPVYLTLITALFLHGGLFHLLGNILFLFIFGDNVEDRLGKFRFLVFYITCGICASIGHVIVVFVNGGDLLIPLLGASGAISGVLGGYLIYYPKKKIKMLFWLLIIPIRFRMRAFFVIGMWFVLQVGSGLVAANGRVAYGAHIVGFLSGIFLALLLRDSTRDTADTTQTTHTPPSQ